MSTRQGALQLAAVLLVISGCAGRVAAVAPAPTPPAIAQPAAAGATIDPALTGWPALEPLYKGHGVHLRIIQIPAGTYTLTWSGRGFNPDGTPTDGCQVLVKLQPEDGVRRTLVDHTVGPKGSEHGTTSVDAGGAYFLTIDGTGCVWTVGFVRS